MINTIKCALYKKGYAKPKELMDKIIYLKYLKIKPYNMRLVKIRTIELDIIDYINIMNMFIGINIYEKMLDVKPITEDTPITMSIHSWLTNNGHILDDIDRVLDDWLNTSLTLLSLFKQCDDNVGNITLQRNSILLRPYIINIESIVDAILGAIK